MKWRKEKLTDMKRRFTGELAYVPEALGECSILPDSVMRKLARMNNFLNEELGPTFLDHFVAEWDARNEVIDVDKDAERTFAQEALEIIRRHCQTEIPGRPQKKAVKHCEQH